MEIDLLGGSYQSKYQHMNSQRTINWLVSVSTEQEKDKYKKSLVPLPGLTSFCNLTGRYNRSLVSVDTATYNRCFGICDQTLYEIGNDSTVTSRGTLSNIAYGTGKIYILCNKNHQLGIFHYTGSYYYNMSTNTLTQITDSSFPGSVTHAAYADGYAFVISGGAVWYSTNQSMDVWSGTQFFSPAFKSSPAKAVGTLKEEVFVFTTKTVEVLVNDGSTPYSRIPRTTISIGIVAPESLVTLNEGFLFVGRDGDLGEAAIYYLDNSYQCVPISPFSCTWAVNKSFSLEEAYGFVEHNKEGHIIYHLTVPDLKTTFVLDMVTREWTERQSKTDYTDSDGTNNYNEFRGRHFCNFRGMNLFADKYSGTIFKEDYLNFTENGNTIKRERISQTVVQEDKMISVGELIITANSGNGILSGQGSTPILMLSYSDDCGYTYQEPHNLNMGALGKRTERIRKSLLGSQRSWTVKFVITDPVDVMISSVIAHGSINI